MAFAALDPDRELPFGGVEQDAPLKLTWTDAEQMREMPSGILYQWSEFDGIQNFCDTDLRCWS